MLSHKSQIFSREGKVSHTVLMVAVGWEVTLPPWADDDFATGAPAVDDRHVRGVYPFAGQLVENQAAVFIAADGTDQGHVVRPASPGLHGKIERDSSRQRLLDEGKEVGRSFTNRNDFHIALVMGIIRLVDCRGTI